MLTIKYQTNWNNKLASKIHTTFRLHNANRFRPGAEFIEELKGKPVNRVKVIRVYPKLLSQVTEVEAFLDTGYGLPQFRKIVQTMYKNKFPDVTNVQFDLVLLEVVDKQHQMHFDGK